MINKKWKGEKYTYNKDIIQLLKVYKNHLINNLEITKWKFIVWCVMWGFFIQNTLESFHA